MVVGFHGDRGLAGRGIFRVCAGDIPGFYKLPRVGAGGISCLVYLLQCDDMRLFRADRVAKVYRFSSYSGSNRLWQFSVSSFINAGLLSGEYFIKYQ